MNQHPESGRAPTATSEHDTDRENENPHADTPSGEYEPPKTTAAGDDAHLDDAILITSQTSVLERFLRYVRYDTQSDPNGSTYPSTQKQLVLLRQLAEELADLDLADVEMDPDYGYVTATVPATVDRDVPVIGFIAHVDTSPEMSGANVEPIVHRGYDGGDIVLPDADDAVITADGNPLLEEQIGNDIVTASGTTLLGADNKAGVAEIMAAAEYLMAHPEIEHGPIRIAFTPDEEIGHGTTHFDIEAFGAYCAYTMDGESLGALDTETFSANAVRMTFRGFNVHPGYAKGRMVNAIKVASDFITRLPRDGQSPETTEGREGFVHPLALDAGVEETSITIIVRDFETSALERLQSMLETHAQAAVEAWPGSSYEMVVLEQYRNMKEVLDEHPEVVARARTAIERVGLDVREAPVRGGTDGASLSWRGLPTPNIFAGEHNYHSRLEWVSVQDMHKAVEVIVNLAALWAEDAA